MEPATLDGMMGRGRATSELDRNILSLHVGTGGNTMKILMLGLAVMALVWAGQAQAAKGYQGEILTGTGAGPAG